MKKSLGFFASTITFILIRNLVIEISFKIHIELCSWCLHTFFSFSLPVHAWMACHIAQKFALSEKFPGTRRADNSSVYGEILKSKRHRTWQSVFFGVVLKFFLSLKSHSARILKLVKVGMKHVERDEFRRFLFTMCTRRFLPVAAFDDAWHDV